MWIDESYTVCVKKTPIGRDENITVSLVVQVVLAAICLAICAVVRQHVRRWKRICLFLSDSFTIPTAVIYIYINILFDFRAKWFLRWCAVKS